MSGELSGQVRDVCGRTIPGATVTLSNRSGAAYRAHADPEGRFVFRDISSPSDTWVLTVEQMAGFEKWQEDVQSKPGVPLDEFNIRLLRDLGLKVERFSTHAAPGTVFHRYSAIGKVTGPNREPVSGATVTLRNSGSAIGQTTTGRCTTDEHGRFDVSQWLTTSARFTLSVEFEGLLPHVQSNIELKPDEHRVINITLQPR